ncbi:MAG TPA: hypothetical protein VFZ72_16940 [Jiangellaceae bacterium]
MAGRLNPTDALLSEPGGVHTVVADRPPAPVNERMQVTAGILEARVGELEIQTVVVGHGFLPPEAG